MKIKDRIYLLRKKVAEQEDKLIYLNSKIENLEKAMLMLVKELQEKNNEGN